MKSNLWRTGICLSALALIMAVATPSASAWQRAKKLKTKPKATAVKAAVGGAKGSALAAVDRFEQAYKKKDKQTMLMKLMTPTQDAGTLEKRYQWLRGYGPKDDPGSKHPPILFESSRGSFVPTSYAVVSSAPAGSNKWQVVVRENGTYRDEDGRYKVLRQRIYTMQNVGGKWYVADYVLKENPEDYGFWVDDIIDKMTKL